MNQPLIVTALFEDAIQAQLDALRERYFPAHRNVLSAHLTLFHAVPSAYHHELHGRLVAATKRTPIPATLAHLMALGRGFAVSVEAPALVAAHKAMQDALWPHLTEQDRKPLRPHVTLQNKVSVDEARKDLRLAQMTFAPKKSHLVALHLWHYDSGPWLSIERYPFAYALPEPFAAPS